MWKIANIGTKTTRRKQISAKGLISGIRNAGIHAPVMRRCKTLCRECYEKIQVQQSCFKMLITEGELRGYIFIHTKCEAPWMLKHENAFIETKIELMMNRKGIPI